MLKYWRQNIQVAVTLISAVTGLEVTFADRTTIVPIKRVKTMQMLTSETPDFIAPTLWPADSPDLRPVDYRIAGKLQKRVFRSRNHDVASLKSIFIEEWEYFNQMITDEAVRQWRSRLQACFQHVDKIVNTYFNYV